MDNQKLFLKLYQPQIVLQFCKIDLKHLIQNLENN